MPLEILLPISTAILAGTLGYLTGLHRAPRHIARLTPEQRLTLARHINRIAGDR